jgi:hypothetical protein
VISSSLDPVKQGTAVGRKAPGTRTCEKDDRASAPEYGNGIGLKGGGNLNPFGGKRLNEFGREVQFLK